MIISEIGWKDTLRQFILQLKIGNIVKLNGFLFFLRKTPLIGKKIPATLYEEHSFKQVIFWLFFIFGGIMKAVGKILLIFILSFLASEGFKSFTLISVPQSPVFGDGLIAWIYIFGIFGGFLSGIYNQLSKKELDFVHQYSLSPREYLKRSTILEHLFATGTYLPALLLYGLTTKMYLMTLNGLMCYLCFYILGLVLNRKLYEWKFHHQNFLVVFFSILFAIGALSIFFLGNYWVALVLRLPLTSFVLVLLFAISSNRLICFKDEKSYLLHQVDKSNQSLTTMAQVKNKQFLSEGLTMQKDLQMKTLERENVRCKGNQYLNALLFNRYRPQLIKGLRYRVYILLVGLFGSVIGGHFSYDHFSPHEIESAGIAILPFLFFVFYLMGYGKKISQMVFLNCDIAMLYYSFYREPKTIISGFLYRFKMTVYYNSILGFGMLVIFLGYGVAAGNTFSLFFYGVLLLLLIALVLLFSFHELFIYYLLQPFTSDMQVVNPLYRFVSGALYWVSYLNTRLDVKSLSYSLLVSGIVFIYICAGLAIIYKKAPQTFRIK
ncbi:hypothetical protein [Candidatus Enterococcus courvalinii]|uniref:ABC transporter permease n=1 Tax=Candidatus Enterococcus courvalinii TaxID=2815329 RepID=A0ABS3HZJ0_9ENTE|nr:hypothetical protein [Enterococcus sp. MSG2901]MBO0481258.1 hypothetical protein [Enterococcus sp. MSG2901]